MENKKERLGNIALLNVVAIFFVILGHSGCIYAGKWDYDVFYNKSSVIRYITNYIYSFHMPLFVFISGYLYSNGKVNKKYQNLKELINKKFKRLIIPYLLIGIFFMLPMQIIFHLDNIKFPYFTRALNEIILAKEPRHLWFILMLFNLFIIFYIIEKYLNKNKVIINLLILVIISIVSIKISNIYELSESLQYLLYFYVGYIFYKYPNYINLAKKKWLVFFMLQIIIFNLEYFVINTLNNSIYIKLFNVLINKTIAFLGIVLIFTFIQALFSKSENKIQRVIHTKLFKKMSKNSYFIYLIHQPIMLVILKEIRNIPIQPIVVYNILFWSTMFISFCLSEIYYFINSIYKEKC